MKHFEEVLSRPTPAEHPHISKGRIPLQTKCDRGTKTEIKGASQQLITDKVAGQDHTQTEALNTDTNLSTNMLYGFSMATKENDFIRIGLVV